MILKCYVGGLDTIGGYMVKLLLNISSGVASMIISFDPGEHIGIVLADNIDLTIPSFDIRAAEMIMYPDRKLIMPILTRYANQLETIIIEDFKLFASKAQHQIGSRFETVKVIERITVYCEELGLADKIVMPEASLQQRVSIPDTVLAQLNYNRHLVSAYKHLRYYVFSEKIRLTAKR